VSFFNLCFKKPRHSQFIRRAFTLIELLIVVAIIAILAAIAVPNFLEAQTRSKVSRAKADMRTVATALESYFVDENHYPPDISYSAAGTYKDANCVPTAGPIPTAVRDVRSFLPRLTVLTTPIAYLTSIPEDPFAFGAIERDYNAALPYMVPFGSAIANLKHPYTFDFAFRINPDGSDEETCTPGLWTKRVSRVPGVLWAMRSIGPDRIATDLAASNAKSYDPTNGTVSFGDIFFLGPGIGPDMGPV